VNRQTVTELQDQRMPVRAKLAAGWVTFMFLYVYVDLLGLYLPGVVEDILVGVVWELDITQTWAVGALTLMAIPILMVVLSVTLPARANRVANLVVASVYVVVSVANVLGESWMAFFGLAAGLEIAVLALVLRTAWTWPHVAPPSTVAHREVTAGGARS
jgi:hypothetical protein